MKFLAWYTMTLTAWTVIYCIDGMATNGIQSGDIFAMFMWIPVVVFPVLLLKNKML